ncbi:MAG: EutN/CcmL family microcompartment protein [Myxococcales bacterium]|nr:EutN/CcmL family microcompartment protein [Myxococcales bacterium]
MKLGRVIGTMVATVKAEPAAMKGLKLLIVRPLTAELAVEGEPFVATDASAQAGQGDLVTYEASREAALLHDPWFVPVDHAIVGIVDQHAYSDEGGAAPGGEVKP